MAKQRLTNAEKEARHRKRFEWLVNLVRGKMDIKHRLRLLLDPDNIRTSTRLSKGQIDFCSVATFIAGYYPEMKPLAIFAEEHFGQWAISDAGAGREEAIRYEGAINESRLFKSLELFKSSSDTSAKKK